MAIFKKMDVPLPLKLALKLTYLIHSQRKSCIPNIAIQINQVIPGNIFFSEMNTIKNPVGPSLFLPISGIYQLKTIIHHISLRSANQSNQRQAHHDHTTIITIVVINSCLHTTTCNFLRTSYTPMQ